MSMIESMAMDTVIFEAEARVPLSPDTIVNEDKGIQKIDNNDNKFRPLEHDLRRTSRYEGEEHLRPPEEIIARESIVTIDTIDKRSHRSALRAQHTYAAKKTVAQGMMDVALITANANQLRYLVEYQRNSPTFVINVILIVVSLLLQVRKTNIKQVNQLFSHIAIKVFTDLFHIFKR